MRLWVGRHGITKFIWGARLIRLWAGRHGIAKCIWGTRLIRRWVGKHGILQITWWKRLGLLAMGEVVASHRSLIRESPEDTKR